MLQAAPRMTLVLGGARSGKSAHAEALVETCPAPWTYLATAQAWDDEMRERIALHRARRGEGWVTRDVPTELAAAIREVRGPVLVDCLTLWLTNLMLGGADLAAASEDLASACADAAGPLVLVSNEVGLGIVPDNALARAFRDAAGRLHQRLAREADRVVFLVAGLPMVVKPAGGPA
ncbi:bifunctional adenosylcobinamide kinase/adenosylcobinamide-phosphate guanylyltransferase [Methylobacterium durans]|uniref:bifunctional adenosylcobinamide kinase/adenosylcobinamide-phosphate guanylyltransferase n=1 Tax=Methylobacterium durans TaxID=2202825 RepID=UPI002AFEDC0C|nr:bifunctional adenosylcobinamide kinase/adenosylcobinamide-phosphate guanylyltransferase [Methylobacterium durans]MEA1834148.1 bifunctional adenosylcobinamide kinase/adenosylcobinamide-phosphate guanylyltransferase [Methylobacterium durans]